MISMKKYLNFHNFGVACFVILIVIALCSFTGSWNMGISKYKVEIVHIAGAEYVVAVTSEGSIAICPKQ